MKKSYWITLAVVVIVGLLAMLLYFSVNLKTKNAGYQLLYWIGAVFMTWLIKRVLDSIFDFSQYDKPTIRKYFTGKWKSEYQEPGHPKSGAYLIEIKNKTEWWENGVHLWNITGFSCEHNNMTFTKVDTQSSVRRKVNQLKIIRTGEEYIGNEDVHTPITYKRVFTSGTTNTPPKITTTQTPVGNSPNERPPRKDGNPHIPTPQELPGLQSEPLRFGNDSMVEDPEIVFAGEWKTTWWDNGQAYTINRVRLFGSKWYEYDAHIFNVEDLKVRDNKLTFLKRGFLPGNTRLLYNELTVEEKYKRYTGMEGSVRIMYEQVTPIRG